MMKLVRGSVVVLGLTDINLDALIAGDVLHVIGAEIGAPGITFYVMRGRSHDQMARTLIASGYDFPDGDI